MQAKTYAHGNITCPWAKKTMSVSATHGYHMPTGTHKLKEPNTQEHLNNK